LAPYLARENRYAAGGAKVAGRNAERAAEDFTPIPALLQVKEGFLPVLAMPERRTEHIACRKSGVGCKGLGDIE